ncbi:MAG TPA: autotransporter outer membrane beta-barrel domain-containing protein, partial [Rhizobiaceae bacterium]|nr:autotransporter outer membrane beta-barrel domain-containing protein [Rhizobiaceae bacterium]
MRRIASPARGVEPFSRSRWRFRYSLLHFSLLASAPAIFAFGADDARAACAFAPPAGDDAYVCDSGTSVGGLNDPGGNNTLQVTGTGTIAGNVTFGAGVDAITMDAGTIQGTVNQGAGADSFIISGGTVTGNVQQGSGIDSFTMSGGQIQSLSQGDNIDVFRMSTGHIVGFFEDGDEAYMSGGRIGRVDMKLDDNLFDMSGGQIDGNLVAGFGNDTIILSNGRIGGNISVSGGTDRVTVTGGEVGGNVLLSFGNDTFTWDGGGTIGGFVDLAAGNDTATLRGLGQAEIGATTRIAGGTDADRITIDDVTASNMSRFTGWETVTVRNGSALTFDDTLTLGDAGTGTGAFTLDASS